MASEVIKLNLIPKGDMPVFHASQFDTGRLITCELYRGEDAYSVPEGYTVELHCRKVDNNIVTMASTLINDNIVTFTSTEQLTACNGNNLCEVAILKDGYRIGTLNFILEVEVDPLKGGITSTSEIHNLEMQIEEITEEVIGDNYYNKTQVDVLLDAKADKSTTYTKTETDTLLAQKANASSVYTKSETDTLLLTKADTSDVYTKSQVETKLALKANASDVYTKNQTDGLLATKADASAVYNKTEVDNLLDAKADQSTTYTKTEVDNLLDAKADQSTTYTKTEVDTALALKANAADVYTKTEVDEIILDIMPVGNAGPSATATFTTEIAADLVDVTTFLDASLTGYSSVTVTVNSDDTTIALGDTYYGGTLDVTRGVLTVTHGYLDLGTLSWIYRNDTNPNAPYFYASTPSTPDNVKYKGAYYSTNYGLLCSIYLCVARGNFPNTDFTMCVDGSGDTPSQFQIKNSNYTDASSFTTAMNGIMLVYELATPVTVQLSPTAVRAIVGTNNVYSDTGDTTVKYKDSIQHYIDKKVST